MKKINLMDLLPCQTNATQSYRTTLVCKFVIKNHPSKIYYWND